MWGLSLFLLSAVFLRYALNYAAVPRQLTCKDHLKTLHTGTWLRAEGRCIMLSKSTGQWDKSSSMNNGFFAASRWEDALGLTAHSANKIIFYSHLKPLVHSFCSPRIMQFALLWLAMCWSSILHTPPSSNARVEVPYKDKKTGEKLWGIFLHVTELMVWERGAEWNYWPLSLLFISAIPVAESAWGEWGKCAATLPEEGKDYLKIRQVSSKTQLKSLIRGNKALLHLTLKYCP